MSSYDCCCGCWLLISVCSLICAICDPQRGMCACGQCCCKCCDSDSSAGDDHNLDMYQNEPRLRQAPVSTSSTAQPTKMEGMDRTVVRMEVVSSS
ncbi:hypothetical protein BC826DRAFT_1029163 [Russula brevipes]|nr:hypothetical protein BC826DRAFT_1029163 [Russula brevipes]